MIYGELLRSKAFKSYIIIINHPYFAGININKSQHIPANFAVSVTGWQDFDPLDDYSYRHMLDSLDTSSISTGLFVHVICYEIPRQFWRRRWLSPAVQKWSKMAKTKMTSSWDLFEDVALGLIRLRWTALNFRCFGWRTLQAIALQWKLRSHDQDLLDLQACGERFWCWNLAVCHPNQKIHFNDFNDFNVV